MHISEEIKKKMNNFRQVIGRSGRLKFASLSIKLPTLSDFKPNLHLHNNPISIHVLVYIKGHANPYSDFEVF
jgi:hypothetical protein